MANKRKVYILNQGVFNMYGYQNLTLPAIVDLTPQEIEDCKAKGYVMQDFTGITKNNSNDRMHTMSCASLLRKKLG